MVIVSRKYTISVCLQVCEQLLRAQSRFEFTKFTDALRAAAQTAVFSAAGSSGCWWVTRFSFAVLSLSLFPWRRARAWARLSPVTRPEWATTRSYFEQLPTLPTSSVKQFTIFFKGFLHLNVDCCNEMKSMAIKTEIVTAVDKRRLSHMFDTKRKGHSWFQTRDHVVISDLLSYICSKWTTFFLETVNKIIFHFTLTSTFFSSKGSWSWT